jgi:hypothetical protein
MNRHVHAEFDAFIADEDGRPGNQLADFMLALSAERAIQRVLVVARVCLTHAFSLNIPPGNTSAIYVPRL